MAAAAQDRAVETPSTRFGVVLACFFVSGLAALIYQTAWTRQFAFVFGTSQLAIATVLAAYMAGLAAGAAVAARLALRVRRPVLVYAVLEGAIALTALAVPLGIRAARWLYVAAFGAQGAPPDEGGLVTALFYLLCSIAILLAPTGFMGATLPLLARHAVRSEAELGSRVGLLYALNTTGAVAGTVLAGFFLLPALGLGRTIWVAVAGNLLVFALAALLGRGTPPRDVPAAGARVAGRSPGAVILPLIALSGFASFVYEVLWTRLLGHVLGESVFAFATMLATFLTGIALGSAAASRLADRPRRAAGAFAVAQLGTAALSLAAFHAIDRLPRWLAALELEPRAWLAVDVGIASAILLPSTFCIGATFPLAVRVLARVEDDAGPASARVYTWNTLGAIAGAVAAGFFLLPWLGLAGTLTLGVAVNLLLALGAATLLPWRRVTLALAAAAVLAAVLLRPPQPPWDLLRTRLDAAPARGPILYYGVGRGATVLLEEERAAWWLVSNGLTQAVIYPPDGQPIRGGRLAWMGALHALARPEAREMLAVGLGGGTTLEYVPGSIESIQVVELEPEMVRANRAASSLRERDPLADPRVRIAINDARGALMLTPRRYDAVISQPSHPWTAGASNLFTLEFFDLVRSHLAPSGIFVQWVGADFVDVPLLRAIVATLLEVFPNVRVYRPSSDLLLLLASDQPLDVEANAPRAIAAWTEDFALLGIHRPEDIAVAHVLDEQGARAFSAGAPLITDDRNLLQMQAPAILRAGVDDFATNAPFAAYDPLARPDPAWNRLYLVRRLLANRFVERAQRVADAIPDPAQRTTAQALLLLHRGLVENATRLLERALEADPGNAEASMALLRVRHAEVVGGPPSASGWVARLGDPQAALVEGWRRQQRDDWDGVRALDARLAAARPVDPAFPHAVRLRAAWRIERGGTAEAREAVALVDSMLPATGVQPSDTLLKARAAFAAGHVRGALSLVYRALPPLLFLTGAEPHVREAAELMRRIPPDTDAGPQRQALEELLRAHVTSARQ